LKTPAITAAVCIIGTELIRGVIQDSHVKLLGAEFAALGIDVKRVMIIPDNDEIEAVLDSMIGVYDIVLTTGGLGPTSDDMTRHAVAHAAGVKLVENQEARRDLSLRLQREPGASNLTQVMFPEGFSIIPNPLGTAPGFMGTCRSRTPQASADALSLSKGKESLVISMPGPPAEMHEMLYRKVIPAVTRHFDLAEETGRTEISVFLVPESRLEDMCSRFAVPGVTWGTRIQPMRISLYLNGESDEVREHMAAKLQNHGGAELFHMGDVQPTDPLVKLLKERNLMIAGAESCSGGYASKILTDRPGSSDYFWGSVITYHNNAKELLLRISPSVLERFGAVSKETALEMAEQVRKISGADAAFSITGIAGPSGGTPDKPAGTVWFGFSSSEQDTTAVKIEFHAYSRDSVRRRAAAAVSILLDTYIRGNQPLDIVNKWQYI
jgi:nicotinamide-nucleotide amidase